MKRVGRLLFLYILAFLARPFVRRPAPAITRILYIKPDHLGDLLLATPVLAALRQRFPEARITALVGPWSQVVLLRNPDVDVLATCPFPGFERRPTTGDDLLSSIVSRLSSRVSRLASVARPYWTLLRYALLLRATRYDLALVGRDDHWWGAALALLAGVPARVGFAVPECRPFLSSALPWDPRAHVTTQGLALVESLVPGPLSFVENSQRQTGDKEQERVKSLLSSPSPFAGSTHRQTRDKGQRTKDKGQFSARFDPAPADLSWADEWLRRQGVAAGERLVVLHPGTAGPAKLWRADRWASVVAALQAAGARVVVTGGPGEEALVAEVAGQVARRPLTLAGQTSLGQLAALLRRAALVLGVDSGPLHLAAAQGVATLHLYGPGDAGRFGPWGDAARHIVLRADLWCSPCGVFSACPRGLALPECMERIAAASVEAQALALLANAPA